MVRTRAGYVSGLTPGLQQTHPCWRGVGRGRFPQRLARACLLGLAVGLLCSSGCASSDRQSGSLRYDVSPEAVSVDRGRDPLVRYRYQEVPYKPYVQQLWTPSGVAILRDAPHDHLHHHALMYAVNVDGVEFWGETEASGKQVSRELDVGQGECPARNEVVIIEHLDWLAPDGEKLLLQEKRVLRVAGGGGEREKQSLEPTLVTWATELSVPSGKESVELSGRSYFGLGARFVESMDVGGRFFNADGAAGVAGTNNVRSRWCAYAAAVNGHPVTVATFDDPGNPRHPATWFTMDKGFAYLSATPDLHHGALTVVQGQPARFRYGVAAWDRHADASQIEARYQRWIDR